MAIPTPLIRVPVTRKWSGLEQLNIYLRAFRLTNLETHLADERSTLITQTPRNGNSSERK